MCGNAPTIVVTVAFVVAAFNAMGKFPLPAQHGEDLP